MRRDCARNIRWGLWDRICQGEGREKSCKDEESVELHDELQMCNFQSNESKCMANLKLELMIEATTKHRGEESFYIDTH
jgi:hypothetical protein